MDGLAQLTSSTVPQQSSLRDAVEAIRDRPAVFSAPAQLVVTISPNPLMSVILRLTIWSFYAAIVIVGLLIANRLVGFDIIGYLLQATRDALMGLQTYVPGVAAAAQHAVQSAQTAAVALGLIITAIVLIYTIPLLTLRWKVYSDRLEYRTSMGREQMVPLSMVQVIGSNRILPFFDFGTITVVTGGVLTRPVRIPAVYHADEKAERLRTLLRIEHPQSF